MSVTGTREAAYVHAITAAGISYVISKGCALGNFKGCGCDETKVGAGQSFTWEGCSQDISAGNAFSKRITDVRERRNAAKYSLMNLHNNQAGREVGGADTVMVIMQ